VNLPHTGFSDCQIDDETVRCALSPAGSQNFQQGTADHKNHTRHRRCVLCR